MTHCSCKYCLWLYLDVGSVCILWIIPSMYTVNLHVGCRHFHCISFCISLGCVSPRSLSLLGRGAGAPQSGIHNLWAAGPCQGSAPTQHVSMPQCCEFTQLWLSFLFFPPAHSVYHSIRATQIQAWFHKPPVGSVKNISFVVLWDIDRVPPPLHIRSSTGQWWNSPQTGKLHLCYAISSLVRCLRQCFVTRLLTAFYCTGFCYFIKMTMLRGMRDAHKKDFCHKDYDIKSETMTITLTLHALQHKKRCYALGCAW